MRIQLLLLTLFCAACASDRPVTDQGASLSTSLRPTYLRAAAVTPRPDEAIQAQIATWREASAKDGELHKVLDALLEQERDGRCRAYLEAGASAWRAAKPAIARQLWQLALGCRPDKDQRLEIDQDTVLVAYGLARRLTPVEPDGSASAARDFPVPDLRRGLRAASSGDQLMAAARSYDGPFVDLLFRSIGVMAPRLSIVREGWVLRVASPAEITAEDQALLTLAEAQRGWMIQLEARIYAVANERLTPPMRELFGQAEPQSLSEGARLHYLRWRRMQHVTALSAPRVVAYPAQRAQITVVSQTAYVADYELSVAEGVAVADPVVQVVLDGLALGVCAVRLPDGSFIAQFAPQMARLARPVRSVWVDPGYGLDEVEIQVPQVSTLGRVFSLRQPADALGWLPLGLLPDGQGTLTGYAVVTQIAAVRHMQPGSEPEPHPSPQ